MIPSTCPACAFSFSAPLHVAGKTVKCPKCQKPITIGSLFDEPDEPAAPTAQAQGQAGKQPVTTAKHRQAAPTTSRFPPPPPPKAPPAAPFPVGTVISAALVLLVLGGGGWWFLNRPSGDGDSKPMHITIEPAAGTPTAVPTPAAQPVVQTPVAAPPVRVQHQRTLTRGIDLLSPAALANASLGDTVFTGSRIVSESPAPKGCIHATWPYAPLTDGEWEFEADVLLIPNASAEPRVWVTLPTSTGQLKFSIAWPTDGKRHLLACWPDPAERLIVSLDGARVPLPANYITAAKDLIFAFMIDSNEIARGELLHARIFSGAEWIEHSENRATKTTWPFATTDLPTKTDDAPAGRYEAYAAGPLLFPLTTPEHPESYAEMATSLACFAYTTLRPRTQEELDLSARILYVGKIFEPANPTVQLVEAELAKPVEERGALPADIRPKELHLDSGTAGVYIENRAEQELVNHLLTSLSHLLNPFTYVVPEKPPFDRGAPLDWPFQARYAGYGEDGDCFSLDFDICNWSEVLQVVEHRPNGGIAPSRDTVSTGATTILGMMADPNTSTNKGTLQGFAGMIQLRERSDAASVAAVVSGKYLWDDGGVAMEMWGTGKVCLLPLGDPFATPLVTWEIQGRAAETNGNQLNAFPVVLPVGAGYQASWMYEPAAEDPVAGKQKAFRPIQPMRGWAERNGGRINWKLWDPQGRMTTGEAASNLPLQVVFRPVAGPGLFINQLAIHQAPPRPSTSPIDTVTGLQVVGGTHFGTVPKDVKPHQWYAAGHVLAITNTIYTVGRTADAVVFLASEPPAGSGIWMIDATRNPFAAPHPTELAFGPEKPGGKEVWKEVRPSTPNPNALHLGCKVALGSRSTLPVPAALMAASNGTAVAYNVQITPSCGGTFGLFADADADPVYLFRSGHIPTATITALPGKPTFGGADWTMPMLDRNHDGFINREDYSLLTLMLVKSGYWLPGLHWEAPKDGRKAANPTRIAPKIIVEPATPAEPQDPGKEQGK